jgi:hypothetical protein
MNGRSRILNLYARREFVLGAQAGVVLATTLARQSDARHMSDRLQRLVHDVAVPKGEIVAAGLRDAGLLAAALSAEADRHAASADAAAQEIARLRARIGAHDRRRSTSEAAAAAARAAEVAEAEARAEATQRAWKRPA